MISVIIPCFNEEKFLPGLLDSIKRQKVDCEIIVADNNSKDNTILVAKSCGCKVVKGGMPGIGRNNGARIAKYDTILFIDADTVLPKGFLKKFLARAKKFDYATCRVDPVTAKSEHMFYYMLKNYGNYLVNMFNPHASGQFFMIKKRLFNKIKGFDESLVMGEEHDLAQRASKCGKGVFFMDLFVYNHPRRLVKDGTYTVLRRELYSEVYRMFRPAKTEIYKKRYGHY